MRKRGLFILMFIGIFIIFISSQVSAWNLSTASYDGKNVLIAQDSSPDGIFFNSSGTRLYELGDGSDLIYQYSCTTAWNLSSCSYDNINISTQDPTPGGLSFSTSGDKLYEIGRDGDKIYQYSCTTAWNLSSCSYDNINISTQDLIPEDLFFNSSGTRLYEIGIGNDKIYQYSCTTAWNLSSCSYDNVNLSAQDSGPEGIFFNSSGTRLYEIGNGNDLIYQYSCTTAWNLSSCSYNNINISTQDTSSSGMFVNSSGTRLYEVGRNGDKIYKYSLSIAGNLSTASHNDPGKISTQDSNPEGLFFNSSGNRMYELGGSTDKIYQYTLSDSWNLSNATYDNVNISTQDSIPQGLFFKDDGTKLYETGDNGDLIYQYSCTTAWNLSSCSYNNINISTQDSSPQSLFFNSSGTRLYELGDGSDLIYQYSCTTAWNLSSCSYDNINLSTQESGDFSGPDDLSFKNDGTKIYEIGYSNDLIYQYTCSDAWNLSSCSYDNINLSTQATTSLQGLFFNSSGTRMYVFGGNGNIYQYTLISSDSTAPSVTINSPTSQTYSTSTITFNATATDSSASVDSCWYSVDSGSTNTTLTNTNGNFYTNSQSLSNASYTAQFYCNDTNSNLNNTESVSFTVDTSTGGGGSSGSTGGSGGATSTASVSHVWSEISPDNPGEMTVNHNDIDVTKITVRTTETVQDASLTLTKTDVSAVGDVQIEAGGETYQAFQINTTKLNDTNIKNTTIDFKVNKTWLAQSNFTTENVTLQRRQDTGQTWDSLDTTLVSEDSTYYYFSSDSPGFSTFRVFVGAKSCIPGTERCFDGNVQFCVGEQKWIVTNECEFGCEGKQCLSEEEAKEGEVLTDFGKNFVEGVKKNFFWIVASGIVIGVVIVSVIVYMRVTGKNSLKDLYRKPRPYE